MEILSGPRDGRSGTPERDARAMPGRTEDRRAGFKGGEPGGQRSSGTERAGCRMKRGFRAALVGVLCLVVPFTGYTAEFIGRVVSLTDGDSLVVLDSQHTQHKICLAGIDAPDTCKFA